MFSLIRPLLAALLAASALIVSSCGLGNEPPASIDAQTPDGEYMPMVTIANDSNKKILVGLNGPEKRFVSIPALSSRSINVLAGTYKYALSAKNSNTISGMKTFESDQKYDWSLTIN